MPTALLKELRPYKKSFCITTGLVDELCLCSLVPHFRVAFYAVVVVFCVEKRAVKVFCLSTFI